MILVNAKDLLQFSQRTKFDSPLCFLGGLFFVAEEVISSANAFFLVSFRCGELIFLVLWKVSKDSALLNM